jgi:hypothetical protein
MHWRNSILAVVATAATLTLVPPGLAQGRRGGIDRAPRAGGPVRSDPLAGGRGSQTPIDEFETMSPEQRQKALNRLPPAQRDKLQKRLQKFNALPAEQQQSLKNLYNRLHQLPPERQEAVRNAVSRFSEQSPQRQQAMREELQNMSNLSEQERQERLASSDFRKKFNHKEQGIVRDMGPLLPAQ